MQLRDYQIKAVTDVYNAWNEGHQNVCLQLATGAGKTACLAYIMANYESPSIAIAHRTELVSQLSLTLAQYGVYHNIIAPKDTVREIVTLHSDTFGQSYYDPQAIRHVGGVLTILNHKHLGALARRVGLIVFDEGHHVLQTNTWGKVANLFPTALGLFPTATPQRSDGKGLGRHAEGIIDKLVIGVSMRELIQRKFLTEYRIIAPPSDLDLTNVNITASGEFSLNKLRTAVHESHITGGVVEHYLKVCPGKLGITFAIDIESSQEICNAYRQEGVPAETISSKTPPLHRAQIMRRFRAREILQLVNVDILGEGVDVPAVEVVTMARPTMSFNVYAQQFGRCMRPSPGKTHGILIDHVNNWRRHGLPDAPRIWTLDRRERRARTTVSDGLKYCMNLDCLTVYPRTLKACPECGYFPEVTERRTVEQVDGDLTEVDVDILAALRGEIQRIDGPPRIPQILSTIAQLGVANTHKRRQEAQAELRHTIAQWAGYLHADGKCDSEIHRTFYLRFGTDIMSAQTLGASQANKMRENILADMLTWAAL